MSSVRNCLSGGAYAKISWGLLWLFFTRYRLLVRDLPLDSGLRNIFSYLTFTGPQNTYQRQFINPLLSYSDKQTFISANRSSSWSTGDRNLPLMTQSSYSNLKKILLVNANWWQLLIMGLWFNTSRRIQAVNFFLLASAANKPPKQTERLWIFTRMNETRLGTRWKHKKLAIDGASDLSSYSMWLCESLAAFWSISWRKKSAALHEERAMITLKSVECFPSLFHCLLQLRLRAENFLRFYYFQCWVEQSVFVER